jgi:hypothetical protein
MDSHDDRRARSAREHLAMQRPDSRVGPDDGARGGRAETDHEHRRERRQLVRTAGGAASVVWPAAWPCVLRARNRRAPRAAERPRPRLGARETITGAAKSYRTDVGASNGAASCHLPCDRSTFPGAVGSPCRS